MSRRLSLRDNWALVREWRAPRLAGERHGSTPISTACRCRRATQRQATAVITVTGICGADAVSE